MRKKLRLGHLRPHRASQPPSTGRRLPAYRPKPARAGRRQRRRYRPARPSGRRECAPGWRRGAALALSRLISRSLAGLAGYARQIGELELEIADPPHSHIAEINTLSRALASARGAIRSFALYVPRELVRKVIATAQWATSTATRQEVTVLFSDIRDFTAVSEQHAPEVVLDWLSVYFERLNTIVERHNGVVVQYLGDSIYAMWNAPEADPGHVGNACRCALSMAAAIENLNAENRLAGRPELVTRFGIHTGIAVVGNVGATTRRQYTAMGDTVNVASRLEGMNKEFATTILVSRAVREQAPSFCFRPLGLVTLKGRVEAMEIFELAGATPTGEKPL